MMDETVPFNGKAQERKLNTFWFENAVC